MINLPLAFDLNARKGTAALPVLQGIVLRA
jgi:hypothetical protein